MKRPKCRILRERGLGGKGPGERGISRGQGAPLERGCNGEDGSNGEKVEKGLDGQRDLNGEGIRGETTPPSMERTSMKWGKGLPREDPRESSGVRVGRGGGKGAALEKAGDADLGPGRQAGGKAQKTDRAWILPPLPTEP